MSEKNESIIHVARFLAKSYTELNRLRYETAKMEPYEIANYMIMHWPVIQGTRNQLNIEAIGEQPYDAEKVSQGVKALLGVPSSDDEWISSLDRMPTKADADFSGNVIWWENAYDDLRSEGWKPVVANYDPSWWEGAYFDDVSEVIRNHPYWMRTGLERPTPPEGFST